jgi:PiT family inorganic phosphate transporter
MAWNIGANDVANSMADAVGSKAISVFWAVILAGICEFLGAVLVGSHVTNTIRKGIIDSQVFAPNPMLLAYGMACALLAAAVWLNIASFLGMPVSTTHSIVGAVAGFGLFVAGLQNVNLNKLGQIVASWFISPIAGGFISYIFFRLILRFILNKDKPIIAAKKRVPIFVFFIFVTIILGTIYKGLKHINLNLTNADVFTISAVGGFLAAIVCTFFMKNIRDVDGKSDFTQQVNRVEKIFTVLVVITSCTVAFAHGANDVANAIGPLAAVIEIVKTNAIPKKVAVDLWILVLGGGGIVIGLATFGYRVMRMVGTNITEITPTRGVAADVGATITVLVCSRMGLPIPTTHTLVGAILGVGLARGIPAINLKVIKSIFGSWLATIPVTAGLTILFYSLAKYLLV